MLDAGRIDTEEDAKLTVRRFPVETANEHFSTIIMLVTVNNML